MLLIGDGRGNLIGVIGPPEDACENCNWSLGENEWCTTCTQYAANEARKRLAAYYRKQIEVK